MIDDIDDDFDLGPAIADFDTCVGIASQRLNGQPRPGAKRRLPGQPRGNGPTRYSATLG